MSVHDELQKLIEFYDDHVINDSQRAKDAADRSYGGFLRAEKGKLQETIVESLIRIAWNEVGGQPSRIEINANKIPVEMKSEYLDKIDNDEVRTHIEENIENYVYKISVDKHVLIDKEFVMGIECKSYTENAMLKRILVDFQFLQQKHPNISCYLFQLESQLGGDFSELGESTYGSTSTHTILSHFPCDLTIVTLLKGERKVNQPIHDAEFYKPLEMDSLLVALSILVEDLRRYTR